MLVALYCMAYSQTTQRINEMSGIESESAELVGKLNQIIDVAFSGVTEHIPDVLSQILLLGILSNGIVAFVSFGIICGIIGAVYLAYKHEFHDMDLLWVVSIIFGLSSLCVFSASAYQIAKVIFAPKVYLLEYAAGLL